jgi:hypothetical protein
VNRALRYLIQKHRWSRLTNQQLGCYAEYFVKMEFTLHGFDVYSSEVDDKGIDFVVRKNEGQCYDVQVKSSRDLNYIFFKKTKFALRESLLAAIVLFSDSEAPALYLVPSTTWRKPNALFVSRDYVDKKTRPEWGLNLSERNLRLLAPFAFEETVECLSGRGIAHAHEG